MRNNRLVKSTASLLLAVTVSFSSVMVASATETTSTNAAKTPQYAQSHYPSEAEIEAYLNDPQYKKYGRTREDVEAYLKANAEEDAAPLPPWKRVCIAPGARTCFPMDIG